ncbi:MAG TPA: hypothetical protein VND65_01810 [Candidatus Binatia bacterium]|nr:hypothetical protein [Candidatus Binatia bacterium]
MAKKRAAAKRGAMTKAAQRELENIMRHRVNQIEKDGSKVRFWIGSEPEPDKRPQILVDQPDSVLIGNLPYGASSAVATVFDHLTNKRVTVRRASCGLNCYCALAFVTEKRKLDASDVATILAALRAFQERFVDQDAEAMRKAYPEHFEDVAPLGSEDIDTLCQEINLGDVKF